MQPGSWQRSWARHPHAPTTQQGRAQPRVREGPPVLRLHAGHARGTRCLPLRRGANAWLAPAWLASLCHICSSSRAAAASAGEQSAAHTSVLPTRAACALTWGVRSLLLCVEPLQCEGVARQQQPGSGLRCTSGCPQCSTRQRLKSSSMSHSWILNRIMVLWCGADLWLERTRGTRRA